MVCSLAVSCVAVKRHLSAGCVDQIVLYLLHDLHGASRVDVALAIRLKLYVALKNDNLPLIFMINLQRGAWSRDLPST